MAKVRVHFPVGAGVITMGCHFREAAIKAGWEEYKIKDILELASKQANEAFLSVLSDSLEPGYWDEADISDEIFDEA